MYTCYRKRVIKSENEGMKMTYLLLDCYCQLLERRLIQALVVGKTGISPSAFVFLFFFAYTEVCIYSIRVPSRVRNKVSIKLILFFEV
jgi:hypothetical protein